MSDLSSFSGGSVMYLYVLGVVVFYFLYRWVREMPRVPDKGAKHVYVTGCDSGFGNMLACHLDELGFSVIAGCFTEKGEEELRKRCSSRMTTTHLNVRSQGSIGKVAAMIKDKVGERGALCSVVVRFVVFAVCRKPGPVANRGITEPVLIHLDHQQHLLKQEEK